MDQNKTKELLKKATALITSVARADEQLIDDLQQANDRKDDLTEMEIEIPLLAREGNSKKISQYVHALEHFHATADMRKILHYFAQSESVRGLSLVNAGSTTDLKGILSHISDAFTLANDLDKIAEFS